MYAAIPSNLADPREAEAAFADGDAARIVVELLLLLYADDGRVDAGEHHAHAREARDLFLRALKRPALGLLLQRALDDRHQPVQPVLQHVVRRAALHRLHRALLSDRSG